MLSSPGFFFNPFPHNNTFWRPWETSLLKTLWEMEKLLVTSNFSFSHSVFYQYKELCAISVKFENVVCKLFQFGRVLNLSCWKRLIRFKYSYYKETQKCLYTRFVTTRFVIKTRFVIIYYKTGWENIITIRVDSYNPFCNKNPNCNKTLSLQWKEKIYLSQ